CRVFDSVRWVVLKTEKSIFRVPGPWRMLRPASPQVPGVGFAKAAVLNHSASVRWPVGSDPLPFPPIRSARGVRPSPTRLDERTENGKPSKYWRMEFRCHPCPNGAGL